LFADGASADVRQVEAAHRTSKEAGMTTESALRLRLLDLDALDAQELRRMLPAGSYAVEKEELPAGVHGDLGATAAIVVLAAAPVLRALAAWLLKTRHKESVVLRVEKIGPDNTVERRSLTINLTDSNTDGKSDGKAEVLRQLVDALKLDPHLVAAASDGALAAPDGDPL